MDKIIWIYISILCLSVQCAFSQKDTLNTYMISYKEKVITSVSLQNESNSFTVIEQDGNKSTNYELFPNLKQHITFGLTYKLLDVSFGYTPWFMKTNTSKYKSDNFNFSTRFNYKNWYQSVYFRKQKGFFTDYEDKTQVYVPTLRSIKVGGTVSYVLNKNFSYSALFNQNEWQIKSAGSLVVTASVFYTNLMNKGYRDDLTIEMYSISLAPAYYYTWVINKKIFLSGGLGLGAGIKIDQSKTAPLGELVFNTKLGYNTTQFYSYIELNGTDYFYNQNATQINDTFISSKIAVGYRFNPPKKVKKVYNDVTDKAEEMI